MKGFNLFYILIKKYYEIQNSRKNRVKVSEIFLGVCYESNKYSISLMSLRSTEFLLTIHKEAYNYFRNVTIYFNIKKDFS